MKLEPLTTCTPLNVASYISDVRASLLIFVTIATAVSGKGAQAMVEMVALLSMVANSLSPSSSS